MLYQVYAPLPFSLKDEGTCCDRWTVQITCRSRRKRNCSRRRTLPGELLHVMLYHAPCLQPPAPPIFVPLSWLKWSNHYNFWQKSSSVIP